MSGLIVVDWTYIVSSSSVSKFVVAKTSPLCFLPSLGKNKGLPLNFELYYYISTPNPIMHCRSHGVVIYLRMVA